MLGGFFIPERVSISKGRVAERVGNGSDKEERLNRHTQDEAHPWCALSSADPGKDRALGF